MEERNFNQLVTAAGSQQQQPSKMNRVESTDHLEVNPLGVKDMNKYQTNQQPIQLHQQHQLQQQHQQQPLSNQNPLDQQHLNYHHQYHQHLQHLNHLQQMQSSAAMAVNYSTKFNPSSSQIKSDIILPTTDAILFGSC